jgi:hypothetical protein
MMCKEFHILCQLLCITSSILLETNTQESQVPSHMDKFKQSNTDACKRSINSSPGLPRFPGTFILFDTPHPCLEL